MLIEEIETDWCENIKRLCINSRIVSDSVKSMCKICDGNVKKLSKLSREISKHSVEMPESPQEGDFRRDFDKVYEEICEKGRIRRIFRFLHPECEYILDSYRIDDAKLNNMDQVIIMMLFIEMQDIIKDTARLWNNTITPFGGPVVDETLQGIIELEIPLEKLSRAVVEERQYIEKDNDIKRAI